MKKRFLLSLFFLLATLTTFAQTPITLSYQAVVRNANNHLVQNATFSVEVRILQGSIEKYTETRTVTSSQNGMISYRIGDASGRTSYTGTISNVTDWSNAVFEHTYHLPDGDVTISEPVNAVPYALQAGSMTDNATLSADNVFTGTNTFPSGFTLNYTTFANCDDVAVNACDLVDVFDSIQRKVNKMELTLQEEISRMCDTISRLRNTLDSIKTHSSSSSSFICGLSAVEDEEGNAYNTVKIGDQCWMKENLRISNVHGYGNVYTPDNVNTTIYGRLYDWAAVMQGSNSSNENPSGVQGLCPSGWHLPSHAEWTQLADYVGTHHFYFSSNYDGSAADYKAKALASTYSWENCNAPGSVGNKPEENNILGFSAMASGYYDDSYTQFGRLARFWTATEFINNENAYQRTIGNQVEDLYMGSNSKGHYLSVRCVRNN